MACRQSDIIPNCSSMKRSAVAMLVLLTAAVPSLAQDGELASVRERELEEVRERISALKRSMDGRALERDRVTRELQEAEMAIAEKRGRIRELGRERDYSIRRKQQLETELAARGEELDKEADELATQLRAAYMNGGQERMQLFLNQRDPARIGRLMAYYGYLNAYRTQNIETVTARIREIAELRDAAAAEAERIEAIADKRYRELTALNTAQEQRQALLASLSRKLEDEGREIERLAGQEKELERLLAELTSILSDYPINSDDPFAAHKGRLTWPVAGRLMHDFGQPRVSDQLRWNGVVLAAPRGREVRAVYHGRVVFADWLAGLGLLLVVDHGGGYMTLYGYNETILKNAGDWVAPGDVIATVGDSGGQPRAALYFEIREGARPVNPRQWVTRQPKG